ncbi:ADP-ribosylation factor-related protein 1 [Hordeum vulgare]|nr:ADP-ribosylation factor-related protein 1 [Hordeum vulgare]
MVWWSTGRKGVHDHEAGSSFDRRRTASSEHAPPAFAIAPPVAPTHDRKYVHVDVSRRYWETGTPLPWSDVHLPNNSHPSTDQVSISSIPMSGCARREEIDRRRRMRGDLYYD